jgi:NADH:ubiquinone oxidoreductase subunit 3 (subunit A)
MTLLILILFVPVLTAILLLVNVLLAPSRPDYEKTSTYECGYDTLRGQTRAPFTISYYLVAVLFLAFDLEILLIYPLSVTMYLVSSYGFWIAVIFFLVLTLGFVVEVASGVLVLTDQRSAISTVTIDSSGNSDIQ